MKTTLDLPPDLVTDACAVLGVTSASKAVELALREVVRKDRARELKQLFGRLHFEALGTMDVRSRSQATRRHRRPKA